jgi:hypothetical protein
VVVAAVEVGVDADVVAGGVVLLELVPEEPQPLTTNASATTAAPANARMSCRIAAATVEVRLIMTSPPAFRECVISRAPCGRRETFCQPPTFMLAFRLCTSWQARRRSGVKYRFLHTRGLPP